MAKSSAQSLFTKMYGATKDSLKEMKMPLAERTLKRKFQTAYDSAETTKIEAEAAINSCMERLENYDLNAILKHKQKISEADDQMAFIRAHYEEMFGESM